MSSPPESGPSGSQATSTASLTSSAKPKAELKGFRVALANTGIPHSVLTWKPRLPSRNWSIFLTVVGSITYLYWDDRQKCKKIREEYIKRVEHLAQEPLATSLDIPRKVTVIAARWPEDDDDDRAARYFRKYIKPYLAAAAIDYETQPTPLLGSITRTIHADAIAKRRQALALDPTPTPLSFPVATDPEAAAKRELEGGTIIVGRHSLKEYMEGLRRGYMTGVNGWNWKDKVQEEIQNDGVFDPPKPEEPLEQVLDATQEPDLIPIPSPTSSPHSEPSRFGALSFLSRSAPSSPPPAPGPSEAQGPPVIAPHLHLAPSPLPPQPPILLVPFVSRLGFKQTPWMLFDFFTERFRVQAGADAAVAVIQGHTRPFVGPNERSADTYDGLTAQPSAQADTEFDREGEKWYKKPAWDIEAKQQKARSDYYDNLASRLDSARALDSGEREPTKEEREGKRTTVDELRKQRLEREQRWRGQKEGWDIVRPETDVTWDDSWRGWLRVFDTVPSQGDFERTA